MTRTALKQIVEELGDACHVLKLALPEMADPDVVALHLQRVLDAAQQRMDDARKLVIWHDHLARLPETMGNIFREDRSDDQTLCVECHRYWPPAGKTVCARCCPVPPYVLP